MVTSHVTCAKVVLVTETEVGMNQRTKGCVGQELYRRCIACLKVGCLTWKAHPVFGHRCAGSCLHWRPCNQGFCSTPTVTIAAPRTASNGSQTHYMVVAEYSQTLTGFKFLTKARPTPGEQAFLGLGRSKSHCGVLERFQWWPGLNAGSSNNPLWWSVVLHRTVQPRQSSAGFSVQRSHSSLLFEFRAMDLST